MRRHNITPRARAFAFRANDNAPCPKREAGNGATRARTASHIVSVIIKVEKPEQFHVKMHENAGNKTNDRYRSETSI